MDVAKSPQSAVQTEDAQADDQQVEPTTNNTAQVEEQLAPAEAGTVQLSTLGT